MLPLMLQRNEETSHHADLVARAVAVVPPGVEALPSSKLARKAHRTVRSLELHSESEILQEEILLPSLLFFSRQLKT